MTEDGGSRRGARPWLFALTLASIMTVGTPSSAPAEGADGYLAACGAENTSCASDQAQFRKWFPKAYAKDYQGQRNVSYCLASGCGGAVTQNRPLGCAWRLVIIASGSPKVDSTDTGFFDAYCKGRLSDVEMVQMRAQAGELFRRIYKRSLP